MVEYVLAVAALLAVASVLGLLVTAAHKSAHRSEALVGADGEEEIALRLDEGDFPLHRPWRTAVHERVEVGWCHLVLRENGVALEEREFPRRAI